MTEQLHRLIDSGAPQPVVNERIAGLMEGTNKDILGIKDDLGRIGSDHEKRIRFLERSVYLGAGGFALIATVLKVIDLVKHP